MLSCGPEAGELPEHARPERERSQGLDVIEALGEVGRGDGLEGQCVAQRGQDLQLESAEGGMEHNHVLNNVRNISFQTYITEYVIMPLRPFSSTRLVSIHVEKVCNQ